MARIEHLVTSGTFSLDGGTWDVDNNVWIIGDDHEVVVIDPAHDADAIAAAVSDRQVTAIVCTHGHNDHINAAPALAERTGAPILIHLDDRLLWKHTHPDRNPDGYLSGMQRITVAGRAAERQKLAMSLRARYEAGSTVPELAAECSYSVATRQGPECVPSTTTAWPATRGSGHERPRPRRCPRPRPCPTGEEAGDARHGIGDSVHPVPRRGLTRRFSGFDQPDVLPLRQDIGARDSCSGRNVGLSLPDRDGARHGGQGQTQPAVSPM